MPYNPQTVTSFYRPGVNPQSMNPNISGDNFYFTHEPTASGQNCAIVVDGAWVKGFEALDWDIAQWSSHTIQEMVRLKLQWEGDTVRTAYDLIASILRPYSMAVADLRQAADYNVTPPAPFENMNIAKIGPQSAFAMALFNPDGSLEIAQVRDCLIAFEHDNGTMTRQTPNQSESVEAAGKLLGIQNEDAALFHYQSVAQDIILNGLWQEKRHEVAKLAEMAHKPAFWPLWQNFDATMPDTLSGEEGFQQWHQALSLLTLCYNSATFLNNPKALSAKDDNGDSYKASWAMFTGEDSMLPLTFFQTFTAEELEGVKAVWLMSDGAFKQGDRGKDLIAMRDLGPEKYYEEVLLPRFDNATPGRKRYAEDRVPMDVTILRVPLKAE